MVNLEVTYLQIWKKVLTLLTIHWFYYLSSTIIEYINGLTLFYPKESSLYVMNGHNSSLPEWLVVFHKDQFFDYFNLFLLYVNDLPNTFSLLTFHSCLLIILTLFSSKNLSHLEKTLNQELTSLLLNGSWSTIRLGLVVTLKLILFFFTAINVRLISLFALKTEDVPIK